MKTNDRPPNVRNADRPNHHGLRRSDLSEPQKRALRQACGFGCVLCGSALYEYAHVDPPFEDAKEHDIERMALLCPDHHDRHDKWKRISTKEVMTARANPKALQEGFARDHFSGYADEFVLTIGSSWFFDCHSVLNIEGVDVLRIDPPEDPGGPYRMNAIFCDAEGALVANIVDNEIRSRSATWDIEVEGPKITFRSAPRQISLVLITIPGRGLRIERMDLLWLGARITTDHERLVVSGTVAGSQLLSDGTTFQSCRHCITVADGEVYVGSLRCGANVSIIGGAVMG